jgi:ornithine cyclodeaminase
MTRFLDVATLRDLVASIGLEQFTAELAETIRQDFVRWPDFAKSPRTANYFPAGVIELMPVSDHEFYSFKYVNGHPANILLGFPTVMGFIVLAEVSTGKPLLIAEGTISTAIRTAATSALAASKLANPNARTMAIIGCGAQSEFQTVAFKRMLGILEVRYFDVDPAAMEKFEHNLAEAGLQLRRAGSIGEAVTGADIVTLATADKKHAAVLTPEMVQPGIHINAIGGDCPGKTELHPDILAGSRVFVEFEPQSRHEGDVQQMTPDFQVTELWKVLAGLEPGRQSPDEVTVFDSVGFAIEDFSMARYLYNLAEQKNLGSKLDLVAIPSNPKDMYGLLTK